MIDANKPTNGTVVKQETPKRMTTTMILTDLDNGIDRNGIKEKYALEAWMVSELFKHPKLKGKKAKKKRSLPFEFVDDTVEESNPNQVTLEQAIDAVETKLEKHSLPTAEIEAEEGIRLSSNNIDTDLPFDNDGQLTNF